MAPKPETVEKLEKEEEKEEEDTQDTESSPEEGEADDALLNLPDYNKAFFGDREDTSPADDELPPAPSAEELEHYQEVLGFCL